MITGGTKRARLAVVAAAIVVGSVAVWATAPLGFLVNQTLASGVAWGGLSQHMQVNKNADGSITPWQLQLQIQGDTDYYSHHLVIAPGGYSGWHSHPGILIGAVKTGQVDYYDERCRMHTVHAGEVFTDNDKVHAIINTGNVDADMYLTFLVKHGAPRRLEEAAPDCAIDTPIP